MVTILHQIIRRTRQHHAIEHATIHLLSAQHPQARFSGVSDPLGFTVYGEADVEAVRQAVGNALLRLQAGENDLAIHPNCGSNLAVSGVLVSFVALLVSGSRRHPLEKFLALLPLMLITLTFARPLGYRLQEFTTLADVSDRWVMDVQPLHIGTIQAHRVLFE